MNLPNRLTLVRIILIPAVCIAILLAPAAKLGWLCWLMAGLIFGAAAITDALDGAIARKRGLITDFGKLMDPVADKLLVTATLTCFVSIGICSPWVLIIVLAREFLVTSIRMVAAGKGNVIAANKWGKTKTVVQIIAIVAAIVFEFAHDVLLAFNVALPQWFGDAMLTADNCVMWISAGITVVSGAVYMYQNRKFFKDA